MQEEINKIKQDYNRINNKLNKTIYEINKIKEEKSSDNFDINRNNSISSNQSIKSRKLFDVDPTSLNSVYNLINDSYNIIQEEKSQNKRNQRKSNVYYRINNKKLY